ncbi:AlpA family phage regulatory protein [Variovorax gossypii]|uniref:AlpA family phage regulatory protein n=1 Tax=Variovorax gossypii TaxID=1679495 RepID=A0A431TI12_9BURK|nr:AlpA family phage regulatory protein [Variovorax gossypii]RTQ32268.1 AlpA family phage regulatory protein [Variovorax gossypii]
MFNSESVHMQAPPVLKATPGDRFLRIQEVERRVCLKKSAIYSRMSAGKFPRSVSLGRRCTVWLKSSIDAWIVEQVDSANGVNARSPKLNETQASEV